MVSCAFASVLAVAVADASSTLVRVAMALVSEAVEGLLANVAILDKFAVVVPVAVTDASNDTIPCVTTSNILVAVAVALTLDTKVLVNFNSAEMGHSTSST